MIAEDDLDLARAILAVVRKAKGDPETALEPIAKIMEAHRRDYLVKGAKRSMDAARMDWLVKNTEFRFRVFDLKTKTYLRENYAQGVVLRPVIDGVMEKHP